MGQLTIVTTVDLDPLHEQQIRSFIRLHWHDEYAFDLEAPLWPPQRQARHVLIHHRHALFSHARVHWTTLEHDGIPRRVACLGDVLTYPAFRRRGLGRQVVASATALIRDDEATDFGILFCDPANAGFYSRHGWEAPDLSATCGFAPHAEPLTGLPMTLSVTTSAPTAGPLHLPGYGW